MGHLLTENRNGLIVQASVSQATGTAEREVSLEMLNAESGSSRRTLGADKNYDTQAFVADCRKRKVTAHVAQKKHTAIDGRTTRRASCAGSIIASLAHDCGVWELYIEVPQTYWVQESGHI
jgi:hypothetical protein